MVTIKKYHNNQFNDITFIKQFSSFVRFAFNRRKDSNDSLTISSVEKLVKEKMLNSYRFVFDIDNQSCLRLYGYKSKVDLINVMTNCGCGTTVKPKPRPKPRRGR